MNSEENTLVLKETDVRAASAGLQVPSRFDSHSPPPTPTTTPTSTLPAQTAVSSRQKYHFTLDSKLIPISNKDTVGFEVPEGIRLHVQYGAQPVVEPKPVTTRPAEYNSAWPTKAAKAEWEGIDGTILSGGDWVLIQKNGVARFDARVTIKTVDNVLIDAVFTGAVDLHGAVPGLQIPNPRELGSAVYRKYLHDPPELTKLPVTLGVRFEAAEMPYLRPGEDDAWIAKSRYAKQRLNFPKYQRLLRGLFFAKGDVTLELKPRWPPTAIYLNVFEMN